MNRGDQVEDAALGAGFACLRTLNNGGVFCVGDDRFGQRGGSSTPGPDARARDPAFVRGTWPADSIAAGTWHACALALPKGLSSAYAVCWGRDDAGQLGGPATATCTVGDRTMPCARLPIHGPSVGTDDGLGMLAAGDLFTCQATSEGIRCWGASRDGFFGTPLACPDFLRRGWPTLSSGMVAAPRAACAPAPISISPPKSTYPSWLAAGPRGLCVGDREGGSRCFGAIPTPRGGDIARATPSPGDDAAACGISGGGVVCWGQGYSADDAYDRPVAVAFADAVPAGEAAELDLPAFAGPRQDRTGRRLRVLTPFPVCVPEMAARAVDWSDLSRNLAALAGQTIRVRGPLDVSDNIIEVMTSLPPHVSAALVIAGVPPLVIADHGCSGSNGRLSCDLPAYGQIVVATGRLEAHSTIYAPGGGSLWYLTSPVFCEEKLFPP